MYALEEVRGISVPCGEFNRVVGYAPDNFPRGFAVMEAQ